MWVNYNDLTATSLGVTVSKGNHPQMAASFRLVNYYYWPIHTYMLACMHASIHTYIHACIHPSIHPSIHKYIHPFIHPSIHTYIHTIYIYIIYEIYIYIIISLYIPFNGVYYFNGASSAVAISCRRPGLFRVAFLVDLHGTAPRRTSCWDHRTSPWRKWRKLTEFINKMVDLSNKNSFIKKIRVFVDWLKVSAI